MTDFILESTNAVASAVATDKARRDMAAALRNTPAEALREAGYLDRAADMLAQLTPASASIPADVEREGCIGRMTPRRATYFLERFKRDEKMLGPHEQWALDYAIATLAAAPTTTDSGASS